MRIATLLIIFLLGASNLAFASGNAVEVSPKSDAQALVDVLLPLAESVLKEHGEFFPFGAQLTISGAVESVAASDGHEHPPSQELLLLLRGGMAQGAKEGAIRCSGIAYDARLVPPGSSEKSDAVLIELEHKEGYRSVVVFPYSLNHGQVVFGNAFAMPGTRHVFP